MKVTCTSLDAAISDHGSTWRILRNRCVGLDSPFFSPRFYQAAQSVGRAVEVATVRDGDRVVAIWPFERSGARAVPTIPSICEITGAITEPDAHWDPKAVLAQCGAREWVYDCSPASQIAFQPHHIAQRLFPVIDLSDGWDAYQSELRSRGSSVIKQVNRKARRIAREHVEPHFVFNDRNPVAIDRLVAWKREQYRRTGVRDVMQPDWFCGLIHQLHQTDTSDLSGLLSTLYLGDQPIAVHFGLRSENVLAWWFTSYDPAYAGHSPGNLLLVELMKAAAMEGVRRIDLGQGDERYKGSFSNRSFAVAEGIVSQFPWNRLSRNAWVGVRDWAQTDPRCTSALRLFRWLRHRSFSP
ncbi:MAG: GNAT family N-acetyltransferase [Candidatus Paceibacterota bacterium]